MTTSARRILAIALAAVLGLAIAVALAVFASRLSTQRIGLAGEPPGAGSVLAIPPRPATTTTTAPGTVTVTARPPTTATTVTARRPAAHEDD